jgi:flagellar biosynthetic protein FlhB
MTGEQSSQAPTPRQRQKAREQGRVVISETLSIVMSNLGLVALLSWIAADALATLKAGFRSWGSLVTTTDQFDVAEVGAAFLWAGANLAPFFAAAVLVICLTRVAQVGLIFVPGNVQPQLSRINPWHRLMRTFSMANLTRSLRFLAALIVAMTTFAGYFWCQMDKIFLAATSPVERLPEVFAEFLWQLIAVICLAMTGFGIVDYVILRWRFDRSLRTDAESARRSVSGISQDQTPGRRRRSLESSPGDLEHQAAAPMTNRSKCPPSAPREAGIGM